MKRVWKEGKSLDWIDEQPLFQQILDTAKPKHAECVKYLIERHLATHMKLRFFETPFAFLFLLEGKEQYHLVWETLKTAEATYVWSFAKEKEVLKQKIPEIEALIYQIREEGKTAYLKAEKKQFSRVFHEYRSGKEGVEKWKKELEAVIV